MYDPYDANSLHNIRPELTQAEKEYYQEKVTITTKCPTCHQEFQQEVYKHLFERYPILFGLVECDKHKFTEINTIINTKHYTEPK